jgi:hypothetical protein
MGAPPSENFGRRTRERPLVQISVRITDEIRGLLEAEASARGVDMAVVARERLEARILGFKLEQGLEQIEGRLEQLESEQKTFFRTTFPEFATALQNRLVALAALTARHEDQISGLGTLFRQGFEKLATAFLKLQNFLEGGNKRK